MEDSRWKIQDGRFKIEEGRFCKAIAGVLHGKK
jgi:hypothetical protein